MEVGFVTVGMRTHRITGTDLQKSPTLVHKEPLYDTIKVGVWCARSATRIAGPVIFWDHKFTVICKDIF
jgi:hypothetical protein